MIWVIITLASLLVSACTLAGAFVLSEDLIASLWLSARCGAGSFLVLCIWVIASVAVTPIRRSR